MSGRQVFIIIPYPRYFCFGVLFKLQKRLHLGVDGCVGHAVSKGSAKKISISDGALGMFRKFKVVSFHGRDFRSFPSKVCNIWVSEENKRVEQSLSRLPLGPAFGTVPLNGPHCPDSSVVRCLEPVRLLPNSAVSLLFMHSIPITYHSAIRVASSYDGP